MEMKCGGYLVIYNRKTGVLVECYESEDVVLLEQQVALRGLRECEDAVIFEKGSGDALFYFNGENIYPALCDVSMELICPELWNYLSARA